MLRDVLMPRRRKYATASSEDSNGAAGVIDMAFPFEICRCAYHTKMCNAKC